MIKKIAVLFVESVCFLFLGIMIVIAFTSGFSFVFGPLKVKAHNFQNPLIVLISTLILRKLLARSFVQDILLLSLLQRFKANMLIFSDRAIQRFSEPQAFRKRVLVGGCILFSLTLAAVLINPLQRGLEGRYYNNSTWKGSPIMTTLDRSFDLVKIQYEFPAMRSNYSIQWTGAIFIPTTATYQFTTLSDDGSELSIGDQLVVDNRGFHGVQEQTGSVHLEKGFHAINIRYMQGSGGAGVEAYWTQPGKKREPLSQALLFSEKPTSSASLWIYWFRRIVVFLLLALLCLLMVIIGIRFATAISRIFPRWSREIQGIIGFILFVIFARLLFFYMGFQVDEYAFLRDVICFLMMGIGISLLLRIGISILADLKEKKAFFQKPGVNTCAVFKTSQVSDNSSQWSERLQKKDKLVVLLFFVLFLFLGLRIFADYGMSVDEKGSRIRGLTYLRYISAGDRQLFKDYGQFHGPAFEILLAWIEIALHLTDSRDIYLMRHLATFLVFYLSVFFFYLLCKERFRDWKIGLLGSGFLILSPRIFADAFYNPKDLPFLSVFIISIYTLVKYLEQKTWLRAALHAVLCGLLIDIRINGVIVPCFTFVFMAGEGILGAQSMTTMKKNVVALFLYSMLLIVFTIVFFPILWEDPLHRFGQAFLEMGRYPWMGSVLYSGKLFLAADLPWHYLLVWVIITTPIFYLVNFLIGLLVLAKSLLSRPSRLFSDSQHERDLIVLLWFFLPLFAVIVLKSAVYDAWRHTFYIYPAFLIIALQGLNALFHGIASQFKGRAYKVAKIVFALIALLSLLPPTYFMVKYHPYQNLYFNQLAGKNMEAVKNNFDIDYWCLTYSKALEYIVHHDSQSEIKVYVANFAGEVFARMLPLQERKRLTYTAQPEEAQYFVANYRWHVEDYPYQDEVYSVKIGGAKVLVVYKLR